MCYIWDLLTWVSKDFLFPWNDFLKTFFTRFQLSKMFCHKCLCCQQAGSLPNLAFPGHSTAFSPVPVKWRALYITTLWRVLVIPPPPVIIYKEYGGQSECACRAGHTLHTLSLRDWRHGKLLNQSSCLLLKNQYAPNRKQSVYDEQQKRMGAGVQNTSGTLGGAQLQSTGKPSLHQAPLAMLSVGPPLLHARLFISFIYHDGVPFWSPPF